MSSNIKRLCHHQRSSDGGWAADAVYLNVHVLPLMRAEGSWVCACVHVWVFVPLQPERLEGHRGALACYCLKEIASHAWLRDDYLGWWDIRETVLYNTQMKTYVHAHTHTHTYEICWEQEMTGGCVMQITCEQHQNSSKQQSPSLIWQPLAGCKARLVLLSKSRLTTAQRDACVCVNVCVLPVQM